MSVKYIAIALSICVLVFVIELIRREKLTFKYAFAWMCVCCLAIVFSIFDQLLFDLAHWFGFELASNFIFFTLLSVFVLLTLLMTLFLCQQNRHNDALAQKMASLQFEIDALKSQQKKK